MENVNNAPIKESYNISNTSLQGNKEQCGAEIRKVNENFQEREYSKTEIKRISVFKHIETNQPISIWQIHKDLSLAYTTVSYIIRDLVFAGIVHERMEINENNTAVKLLSIPKIKEVDK